MIYPELKGSSSGFLVTGGAGFIGSNLALTLLENGQTVTVLDSLITGKMENIVDIESFARGKGLDKRSFRFIEGDIRNIKTCMEAMDGVDFVFHNAALGSVPRSIADPMTSTDINVCGTVVLLTAAKDRNIKRFIYASSSSVYGDSERLPKREGEEGRPLSPYATGKLVGELYAENFMRVYGLGVIGLRYFNIFGPRQDPHCEYSAVIPIFVKKFLSDETPTINGDGSTTRDFTYVENAVQANIKAIFAPDDALGGVYNIACSKPISLNDLCANIASLLNKNTKPSYGPERKGDVRHSFGDISKARRFLNYEPSIDFENGLRLSIEWYKKNL